jgi:hypothetical protein
VILHHRHAAAKGIGDPAGPLLHDVRQLVPQQKLSMRRMRAPRSPPLPDPHARERRRSSLPARPPSWPAHRGAAAIRRSVGEGPPGTHPLPDGTGSPPSSAPRRSSPQPTKTAARETVPAPCGSVRTRRTAAPREAERLALRQLDRAVARARPECTAKSAISDDFFFYFLPEDTFPRIKLISIPHSERRDVR